MKLETVFNFEFIFKLQFVWIEKVFIEYTKISLASELLITEKTFYHS